MGGMLSSTWAPSSREWCPDRDLKRLLIRRTEPEKGIQAEATAHAQSPQVTPRWWLALTGAGVGKWLRGFRAATGFSGFACRKPSLRRLVSSLMPGTMKVEELDRTFVG